MVCFNWSTRPRDQLGPVTIVSSWKDGFSLYLQTLQCDGWGLAYWAWSKSTGKIKNLIFFQKRTPKNHNIDGYRNVCPVFPRIFMILCLFFPLNWTLSFSYIRLIEYMNVLVRLYQSTNRRRVFCRSFTQSIPPVAGCEDRDQAPHNN